MRCFVSIAPGLEDALADELSDIGFDGRIQPGGVQIDGLRGWEPLMDLHCFSRLAGRVTVELGVFKAASLGALADGVRRLPWKDYLHPRQPLDVRATLRGSRLRSREAVQKKVGVAIADALRGPRRPGPRPPREAARIVVAVTDDRARVSVDASGELLHKRGWRKATAKAPLRENLGAALLRLSGWDPGSTLVDPMCGAGTLPIEAARIAAGLVPDRAFAFERWPRWRSRPRRPDPFAIGHSRIVGADRDPGAIKASQSNARRGGVEIDFRHVAFADLEPPDHAGFLVCNPPYGRRVGHGSVYPHLHKVLQARWKAWTVCVIIPKKVRFDGEDLASFSNGGIDVRVVLRAPS